jgi:chemotaxis protein methyltransferase CheR
MMPDAELVALLQRELPRLRLRWAGFRRVRSQVTKRLKRRLAALGLPDLGAYEAWIETHPEERAVLDALCRITITRFFRDRLVFDALGRAVLPLLAHAHPLIRVWSAGCASGEEPYSVALLWKLGVEPRFPRVGVEIVGTDADPALLERARHATYPRGTLREVPPEWVDAAFEPEGEALRLRPELRDMVRFEPQDLRAAAPAGPFQLVLCRNLAFTYFEEKLQREVLAELSRRVVPGGFLVIGAHERVPDTDRFEPWPGTSSIFRLV